MRAVCWWWAGKIQRQPVLTASTINTARLMGCTLTTGWGGTFKKNVQKKKPCQRAKRTEDREKRRVSYPHPFTCPCQEKSWLGKKMRTWEAYAPGTFPLKPLSILRLCRRKGRLAGKHQMRQETMSLVGMVPELVTALPSSSTVTPCYSRFGMHRQRDWGGATRHTPNYRWLMNARNHTL